MSLSGNLLVTGGSRGIGAAVVRLAVSRGYAVAFSYKSHQVRAEELVREMESQGGRTVGLQADVGDPEAIRRLFEDAEQELGALTGVVNNAGITGGIARLDQAEPETIGRVLEVNVLGTILCCQEAVRSMSTAHGGQGGVIVNVSSGAATTGGAGEYVWYAASKGAVDSLTVGLARETAREGIRVNAVAPGLTETEIHPEGRLERLGPQTPLGRAGTPEEIAEPILWLLSDEARYITGEVLRVAGGR